MHVGINTLFCVPGGVGGSETYLRGLLRELPRLDPTITYTLFTNRENAGTFDVGGAPNVREIVCPIRAVHRPIRLAYEYSFLPIRAARARVDVLFSPGFTAPASRRYASIVNILDMQPEDLPGNYAPLYHFVLTRLIRRAVRSATHILTLSEHARQRIAAVYHVPLERITVSYCAAESVYATRVAAEEIARVRQRYGLHLPYILSVATLHPHKNLDVLIDAFVTFRTIADTNVQLALVGLRGNAAATLQAKIRAAGLEEAVIMTGWVPDDDLPALYQGAEVYVLPSRYEGFGIPILEAMASGVPVITTTATALPEVAGDAAILIAPDDRQALVHALCRVRDNPTLRVNLIAQGHDRAALFTWHKTAEATISALHQTDVSPAVSPLRHRERYAQSGGECFRSASGKRWNSGMIVSRIRMVAKVIRESQRGIATAREAVIAFARGQMLPGPEGFRTLLLAAAAWRFTHGKMIPWTFSYLAYKERTIQRYITEQRIRHAFGSGRLPPGYGYRLDERVVEYPWFFFELRADETIVLDAGSVLNFSYLLNTRALRDKRLTIVTLDKEGFVRTTNAVSYLYEDLRALPFKDAYFDLVVCLSTLDHVGLNNSLYSPDTRWQEAAPGSYLEALAELVRVVKPGGRILLSVPYGRYENAGWFQVFDEPMITAINDRFADCTITEQYFKYENDQWQFSDRAACRNSVSRDAQLPDFTDDHLASSRSVVCMIIRKPPAGSSDA